MTDRSKLVPVGLAAAVAITRWSFRSHYLYDVDSVNFALGMQRFDPRVYQLDPPRYSLYVCLGRVLNLVCHDANLALVILSIAASCSAAVTIWKLAGEWFGAGPALFAGLLLLFSPLVWFHGTVVLTYVVEEFFSVVCGDLRWHTESGRRWWIALAGVTACRGSWLPEVSQGCRSEAASPGSANRAQE